VRHSGPSPFAQPFALSAQYVAAKEGTPLDEVDPSAPAPSKKKDEPFAHDLGVRLICRDCQVDPPNLVEEFASGDVVCGDCGLVIGDKIVDTRSECEHCRASSTLAKLTPPQGARLPTKRAMTRRVSVRPTTLSWTA
jgi:hypothetical protein